MPESHSFEDMRSDFNKGKPLPSSDPDIYTRALNSIASNGADTSKNSPEFQEKIKQASERMRVAKEYVSNMPIDGVGERICKIPGGLMDRVANMKSQSFIASAPMSKEFNTSWNTETVTPKTPNKPTSKVNSTQERPVYDNEKMGSVIPNQEKSNDFIQPVVPQSKVESRPLPPSEKPIEKPADDIDTTIDKLSSKEMSSSKIEKEYSPEALKKLLVDLKKHPDYGKSTDRGSDIDSAINKVKIALDRSNKPIEKPVEEPADTKRTPENPIPAGLTIVAPESSPLVLSKNGILAAFPEKIPDSRGLDPNKYDMRWVGAEQQALDYAKTQGYKLGIISTGTEGLQEAVQTSTQGLALQNIKTGEIISIGTIKYNKQISQEQLLQGMKSMIDKNKK